MGSRKKGKIVTLKESEGISRNEAINRLKQEKNAAEIMSVRLGMEKNIPLWEIHYRSGSDLINYYYIDFKTGEWLKKLKIYSLRHYSALVQEKIGRKQANGDSTGTKSKSVDTINNSGNHSKSKRAKSPGT
ncbi:hypothetical protein M5V91_01655 [Cytobacillus pseudoceanisediminis]|uniref:hypothetical protein n=1 Tax=Cytobacillus pseudoceanisediminis TaxID=3051614 RepID=UPI002186DF4D|nr:hypothetical protein [Cytobacillus pseudoceanisediminis]UQX54599.1 hypothetical protein M5V91_01655 [Cytobacillus pseudoceanisediminis]